MEEKVQLAQDELASQVQEVPQSLDDILAGLQGFGIEELEEILTITQRNGKSIRLRISNIPSSDEMESMLTAEGMKGYNWIKTVKIEILSRSISWINGVSIKALSPVQRIVKDPTTGDSRDVQIVLRGLLKGWGQEIVQVLWKILMAHSQKIEDHLRESLPESAFMTDVERRLFEQANAQLDAMNKQIMEDSVAKLYEPEGEELADTETSEKN